MPAILGGVRRLLFASVQVYCIDKTMFYLHVYIGRSLGRSRDKSLKSFHLCYSQSPLLTVPPPPRKSGLKLVCNVNIIYRNLKSENSQDYAQKPQRS
jgi:hypothetical protein